MTNILGTANRDFDWDAFDTDAYYKQYAGTPLFEDRCTTRFVGSALQELGINFKSQMIGIDVGNGGVLRGPSLISPLVSDDGVIVWSDYGAPQLQQAREMIANGRQGNLGKWARQQTHMAAFNTAWSDAAFRACELGVVRRQSIFDLPEAAYDIAITCYTPESLTADKDEWQRAVSAFFGCVKPGHPAVMLYMVGSTGYDSAGEDFPAVPIDEKDVRQAANAKLKNVQTFFIEASHEARPKDDKYGYDGMGGIVGIRK